ncbi:MAG: hypothetical protein ACKOZT_08820 [Cyanobium sp.]
MGASPAPATPAWLAWLQVALSAMLAVLFVVMLVRSREQNLEIQRLRQRVRLLESSRSLDRSAAQDEQIRAVTERVQTMEEILARRFEAAERERQRLAQELLNLHTRPPVGRLGITPAAPQTGPSQPQGPRLQPGAAPFSGTMPLRPPVELP